MFIIAKQDWPGTKQELQDRIALFAARVAAHKMSVGDPAPREEPLVERLYASGEEFDVAPEPAAPTPLTPEQQAEAARQQSINAALQGFTHGGKTRAQLAAMNNAEFDAWWAANVTNLAQANAVLKLIARSLLR